jgi:hypothetical protein
MKHRKDGYNPKGGVWGCCCGCFVGWYGSPMGTSMAQAGEAAPTEVTAAIEVPRLSHAGDAVNQLDHLVEVGGGKKTAMQTSAGSFIRAMLAGTQAGSNVPRSTSRTRCPTSPSSRCCPSDDFLYLREPPQLRVKLRATPEPSVAQEDSATVAHPSQHGRFLEAAAIPGLLNFGASYFFVKLARYTLPYNVTLADLAGFDGPESPRYFPSQGCRVAVANDALPPSTDHPTKMHRIIHFYWVSDCHNTPLLLLFLGG